MKLHNISFNNLNRRKGKMIFLVLGLFIGIATIVTLLSITESMSRDIEDRLDQFGANIVMVPKSENLSLSYGGVSMGGVNYKTVEFDEARIPEIRTIEYSKNLGLVAPKVLGATSVKGKDVLLMGVDFESELALKNWFLQPQFKRANSPANLHISMNCSTVHQAEAFLKDFEETIETLKQEEINEEARDLQAELDKLSIKFDDETFFKLASMAGITGTELPDKMETINQIMEVLPYDVSEWILIEFLNNLMVQPAG